MILNQKVNCHDLAEILLKVAIHTITLTLYEFKLLQQMYLYPDFKRLIDQISKLVFN